MFEGQLLSCTAEHTSVSGTQARDLLHLNQPAGVTYFDKQHLSDSCVGEDVKFIVRGVE